MQALNILERFDLRAMGHNSPEYIHTVAEAVKLAFADREAYYGDPDYATVPIDGLLSKEYGAWRARLIDPARACPETPPCGDPWAFSAAGRPQPAARSAVPAGAATGDGLAGSEDGTTHVSVLDHEGNMVCGTISGGAFAKSAFFPELGCALSTRIEMFNCEDGHPNVVAPGKRPRTTLVNYLLTKDGQPVMTVGCPGGDNQAQANLQLVLNVLVFGMNPQQAIEAPRFSSQSVVNSFYPHVYHPGRLDLEDGIPETTAERLRSLGHRTERTANCGMGATVSRRDPQTGVMSTGGDPRRACYALAL
jgi:gamma-glutamyltranspeptidase/glutathione hydrolase